MVLVLLGGCASDQGWKAAYETEKNLRQEQDARIRALETRQQPQPQPQPTPRQQQPVQPQKVSLREIDERCQRVNQDRNLPVACEIGVSDGHPFIAFTFADAQGMNTYWDSAINGFITDFCGRHNEAGHQAFILARLENPKPGQYRGASCFDNWISEWKWSDTSGNQSQRY